VSTTLGSGSTHKSTASPSNAITNIHVIESAATADKIEVELNKVADI
jgi:hypothetical protein